jgi:hypothetical protein
MSRITVLVMTALLFCAPGQSKEKHLPTGEMSNEGVHVAATVIDSDQMTEIFGSDFANLYSVIEVTIAPRNGKPVEMRLDDFLLRSDQTGEHTGPLMAAQIGGQGALVVKRGDPPRSKTGFGGGFGGIMMGGGAMGAPDTTDRSKVEMKESAEKDPLLAMLKRKILTEKTITEPVTGLLFFPLEKAKPKHLALVYSTPAGKIRTEFK